MNHHPCPAFGKVRSYRCPCGVLLVRPLRGKQKPCHFCGADLAKVPWQVEDYRRLMERLARGEKS